MGGWLIRTGCRKQAYLASGERASCVETRSGRSTFRLRARMASPGAAKWFSPERRIDTRLAGSPCGDGPNFSLKRRPRFHLAPRVGQNGASPGFRAIQHGQCALGALEGRFWLPGRCVRIGGRAPAHCVRPSAIATVPHTRLREHRRPSRRAQEASGVASERAASLLSRWGVVTRALANLGSRAQPRALASPHPSAREHDSPST